MFLATQEDHGSSFHFLIKLCKQCDKKSVIDSVIQEIINVTLYQEFIVIQQFLQIISYVTERHPKSKISGFLTGSNLSLRLSQTTPCREWTWMRMDEWTDYWWVDLSLFYSMFAPSANSSVLQKCFALFCLLLLLLKHWPLHPLLFSVSLSKPCSLASCLPSFTPSHFSPLPLTLKSSLSL